MKPKIAGLVVATVLVVAALGGYSTFDYDLHCSKCLLGKSVVLHKILGIPFYRSSTWTTPAADYEGVFGQPCRHVLRKGGFGRGSYLFFVCWKVGCGSTADGAFLGRRTTAVNMTYELARRMNAHDLARETFAIIDSLMPPNARMSRRAEIPAESIATLLKLSWHLESVRTTNDWRTVLQFAREGFPERPAVPDA